MSEQIASEEKEKDCPKSNLQTDWGYSPYPQGRMGTTSKPAASTFLGIREERTF